MSDKSKKFKQFLTIFIEELENLEKFVEERLDTAKLKTIELRLSNLNTNWELYKKSTPPFEKVDEEFFTAQIRETIDSAYYDIRPELEEKIQALKLAQVPKVEAQTAAPQAIISPKLPNIDLDIFDGNYMSWNSFIGTFDSLVHNNLSLTALAKFQYLKLSLKGPASQAIESLDFNETNYEVARQILNDRFDKPNFICSQHINALFSFKSLDKPCSNRILELLDHYNSHLRSLRSLGRNVDHWDDLIVHLISTKLDQETKSRWIDVAPVGRLPTFTDLCDFLRSRAHRLENQSRSITNSTVQNKSQSTKMQSNKLSRPSRYSTALNVTNSPYQCSYCKKPKHTIVRCLKFLALHIDERQ